MSYVYLLCLCCSFTFNRFLQGQKALACLLFWRPSGCITASNIYLCAHIYLYRLLSTSQPFSWDNIWHLNKYFYFLLLDTYSYCTSPFSQHNPHKNNFSWRAAVQCLTAEQHNLTILPNQILLLQSFLMGFKVWYVKAQPWKKQTKQTKKIKQTKTHTNSANSENTKENTLLLQTYRIHCKLHCMTNKRSKMCKTTHYFITIMP